MKVWKSELAIVQEQDIEMPKDAQILFVREQRGIGCIWYCINPKTESEKEIRKFITVGTGWESNPNAEKYLGSYFIQGGTFVFHVFEKKELENE